MKKVGKIISIVAVVLAVAAAVYAFMAYKDEIAAFFGRCKEELSRKFSTVKNREYEDFADV